MAQLQGELEKSKIGFTWTLEKIEEYMKTMPDDIEDIKELWALTRNWYNIYIHTYITNIEYNKTS